MKKILFLCLFIMCVTCVPVYASETVEQLDEKSIINVIKEQGDAKSGDIVFNQKYYDESMHGIDISDDAILKVYHLPMWEYAANDIDSIISKADANNIWTYVAFREEPVIISEYKRGEDTLVKMSYYETIPTYLTDIMDSSIYNSELSTLGAEYTKIVYFDAVNSMAGITVYYVSGEDTVVYYYENYSSDAIAFTIEDFQICGNAYHEFVSSWENNYDIFGHALGGTTTFAEFLKDFDIQEYMENDNWQMREYGGIIVGLLVIVLIGIVVICTKCYKNGVDEN